MSIVFKDKDDKVVKFNPYHGRDGRFTSAKGGGVSFTYSPGTKAGAKAIEREKQRSKDAELAPKGLGTTKIDMNDLKGGAAEHSLAKHLDKNGKLKPEREELHKEICRKFLEGVEKVPEGEQATFYMLGGGSGAGKTTVMKNPLSGMPGDGKAVKVDADAVKSMLPEYKKMVKNGDENAAKFAHEESSALAKRISSVAQQNGYHVVLDGTGDGKPENVMKKINEAKGNGMRAVAVYVTIPTDVAVARCTSRAAHSGRKVPEEVIRGTHAAVSSTLPKVASQFDEVKLFSNVNEVKLIATGGNGKGLQAVDEAEFQAFLAKANS